MIIGLSAYAQSGKDTAAEYFVEMGYERRAFADVLRQAVYALNPIIDEGYVYYADLIDRYGYERARSMPEYKDEIRRLLQRMGTEVGRNLLGENIWVDAALRDLDPDGYYVFTDCRFPNEAKAIKDLGGEVWRIHRKGVGPANNHPSETSLDDWDFDAHVYNNWGLKEFRDAVRAVAATAGVLEFA